MRPGRTLQGYMAGRTAWPPPMRLYAGTMGGLVKSARVGRALALRVGTHVGAFGLGMARKAAWHVHQPRQARRVRLRTLTRATAFVADAPAGRGRAAPTMISGIFARCDRFGYRALRTPSRRGSGDRPPRCNLCSACVLVETPLARMGSKGLSCGNLTGFIRRGDSCTVAKSGCC